MNGQERIKKYQNVFNTPEGKEVLVDLLGFAGFGSSKPSDTNSMVRSAGREDVVLYLLRQLKEKEALAPEDLLDRNIINTIF